MKSYCVSFSLSFFLQHYVLETNSCHVKLEFIHVQCRMGFHCTRAALYILVHVAWRTWTEVSAEWLPGSRTAVSECVRVSRFNAECQGVVQSDHSGVEGSVPCSRPPQGAV